MEDVNGGAHSTPFVEVDLVFQSETFSLLQSRLCLISKAKEK